MALLVKIWLLLSIPGLLGAQDFFWGTGSARSQAMGGVYLPSSRGAIDALIANPAGLTALGAPTLEASVSSIWTRGSFSNAANTDSPLKNQAGVVPYGAFGTPIGKSNFSMGIGLLPEVTSSATWNYKDSQGSAGANYGLQTQHSAILAGQAITGIGYSVNKFLSVGASVGAVFNSNTLDAPYIFQSNPSLAGLKTLLRLETKGFGWKTGIGLIMRPTDRLQLNASWQSKSTIESTGKASGNLDQQFASLGIVAAPEFRYSALVRNTLPQSVMAGVNFRLSGRSLVALTGNFVNWSQAFNQLHVSLTNGTNATVNSVLASTSLYDTVPVQWKNQIFLHVGFERQLTEFISMQVGFAHGNNPVPASTLSPLTAAISTNKASTGITIKQGVWQHNLCYSISPETVERVGQSGLKGGEYSNSRVRLGLQSFTLGTSYRF